MIPTHDRQTELIKCLDAVFQLDGPPFTVVVAFDGCTDGSQAAVSARFPAVEQVEGDGTLWWSGATNLGIERARALGLRYFLLLNDDVIIDPQALKRLLQAAADHPGAVIGSVILYYGDRTKVWCAGGVVSWWAQGVRMRSTAPTVEAAPVDWLPGMGSLIPSEVYERLGGFDAKAFPQYFGDADFFLRARRCGIPVLICRSSHLYNQVEHTGLNLPPGPMTWSQAVSLLTSIRSHASVRYRLRFWWRHCPRWLLPWQVVRFYAPLLAAIGKKLLLGGKRG